MHGEDREEAYKTLMSRLVLTVQDRLPCEIDARPAECGMAVWLHGPGSASATARIEAFESRFAQCHLLRLQRGRREELRIFSLEPVQIYILYRLHIPPASGWEQLPSSESDIPALSLSLENWRCEAVHSR